MICVVCGKNFKGNFNNQKKNCSIECKKIGDAKKAKDWRMKNSPSTGFTYIIGSCAVCGKKFKRRHSAVYCSNKCNNKAWWSRLSDSEKNEYKRKQCKRVMSLYYKDRESKLKHQRNIRKTTKYKLWEKKYNNKNKIKNRAISYVRGVVGLKASNGEAYQEAKNFYLTFYKLKELLENGKKTNN